MKCAVCNKEIDMIEEDYKYDKELGFIHDSCPLVKQNTKSLEMEIIEAMLLKDGGVHDEFRLVSKPHHFSHKDCHWETVDDIVLDDKWYQFEGTFVPYSSRHVITGRASCACGDINNVRIGLAMDIADVINQGIEMGLVRDINSK